MRRAAGILMFFALPAEADEVGMNTHQPPADILDLCADLGVRWVRIDFNWIEAEPEQGEVDFDRFDRVVDDAIARGLSVYASIGYGPAWASSGDVRGDGPVNDVPQDGLFGDFASAAAGHFDGRIAHWGIWNEPNLEDFFEGTAEDYARLLREGATAIRAACAGCLIAGPETASIGDDEDDYLRAVLEQAGEELDIVTWHNYGGFEETGSSELTGWTFLVLLDQCRLGTCDFWPRQPIRNVIEEAGYGHLPFWITETGEEAELGDGEELERQRTYYQRVLEEMVERDYWEVTIFYEIADHPAFFELDWGVAVRTAEPDDSWEDNFEVKPSYEWLATLLHDDDWEQTLGGDSDSDTDSDTDPDANTDPDSDSDSDSQSESSSDTETDPVDTDSDGVAPDSGPGSDGGEPPEPPSSGGCGCRF